MENNSIDWWGTSEGGLQLSKEIETNKIIENKLTIETLKCPHIRDGVKFNLLTHLIFGHLEPKEAFVAIPEEYEI